MFEIVSDAEIKGVKVAVGDSVSIVSCSHHKYLNVQITGLTTHTIEIKTGGGSFVMGRKQVQIIRKNKTL